MHGNGSQLIGWASILEYILLWLESKLLPLATLAGRLVHQWSGENIIVVRTVLGRKGVNETVGRGERGGQLMIGGRVGL